MIYFYLSQKLKRLENDKFNYLIIIITVLSIHETRMKALPLLKKPESLN